MNGNDNDPGDDDSDLPAGGLLNDIKKDFDAITGAILADGQGNKNQIPVTDVFKAISAGDAKKIQAWLENGEISLSMQSFGMPLFQKAISENQAAIVEIFIKAGADPSLKVAQYTPLEVALLFNRPEMTKLLIAHKADASMVCADGMSLLYHAVEQDKAGVVLALVAAGADLDAVTKSAGHSALQAAILKNSRQTLAALLTLDAVKARIDEPVDLETGDTLLHLATKKAKDDVCLLLLDAGAGVDVKNSKDQTPLHVAAFSGQIQLVEDLIKRSANVDAPDKIGRTPLMAACSSTSPQAGAVIHALLAAGADPLSLTHTGTDVLSFAARNKNKAAFEMLFRAFESGHFQADINHVSQDGMTPLHHAIEARNWPAALILLVKGADPNIHHGPTGDAPLHMVLRLESKDLRSGERTYELCEMLLSHGANPAALDKTNASALTIAKDKGQISGQKVIEKYLEKSREKRFAKKRGGTPPKK